MSSSGTLPPRSSWTPKNEEASLGVVDAWCAADRAHAVFTADREAIETTRSVRALIVASLYRDPAPDDRDVLNAFGALGRMIAEKLGSPTLVATSVDGLVSALREARLLVTASSALASAGRAAMVESYFHTRIAAVHTEGMRGWEYPACAVRLESGYIAIAAGYPVADDGLDDWAARVAQGAALSGVRYAVVSGPEKAVEALDAALGVAGIQMVKRQASPATTPRPRRVR